MHKKTAIDLLGGSVARAAEAIGINSQAISQWPDLLPARLIDRVIAACVRNGIDVPAEFMQIPAQPAAAKAEG